MRFLILSIMIVFCGCAATQTSGYLSRNDRPYDREIYGGFEKVVSTVIYVLKKNGWRLDSEVDPAVFERDERYENNGYRNLLIITQVKKNALELGAERINVFIHSMGNICEIEIRYEKRISLVKQFVSVRNDAVVDGLLDALNKELR